MLFLFYIGICLLVAIGFSNTKWGYWGGFLFSLLLSPIVGIIVMCFMPDKPQEDSIQTQILLNQQQLLQQQLAQKQPKSGLVDELTKLEELKTKKLITDDEYNRMREKLMKDFI